MSADEETMAKTKFRPLHDRVVVRRLEAEEKTKGGIIIPDTAKEKPSEGEVVAVGPGGRDETGKLTPMDVKAGDRVLFGKWSGTEVKLDGEDAHGAFDITYASVGYLYDFRRHIHPDQAAIAAALPGINFRHMILDEKKLTVYFS